MSIPRLSPPRRLRTARIRPLADSLIRSLADFFTLVTTDVTPTLILSPSIEAGNDATMGGGGWKPVPRR